jgi:hypothetical protein
MYASDTYTNSGALGRFRMSTAACAPKTRNCLKGQRMTPTMRLLSGLVILVLSGLSHAADEPIALQEKYAVDYQYHVRVHVDLSGTLQVPREKDTPPKRLEIRGDSVIEYNERVLHLTKDGEVDKTARMFSEVKLQRTVDDRKQEATVRESVRRMILLRRDNTKVPFSPDGALTWGEIDLVRTDVFTPALHGLLPDKPVRQGDKWKANKTAVQALTDMATIEEGELECKFDEVRQLQERRVARVVFTGTIRGTNEDGSNKQRLDGYLFFDLESNHISYLSLQGVHSLPDKDGKEAGRLEGRFVLSRQVNTHCKELSDEGLKGATLEPTEDNTRLLYDNPEMGVKFLYPRRWRASERANQVTLDTSGGIGLLLTVEPLDHVPTGVQFLAEARANLEGMKAKISRASTPRKIQDKPLLEEFSLDAEVNGQKVVLQYYVAKHARGGVTIAARLVPDDGLADLQREVERIARSVEVTRK